LELQLEKIIEDARGKILICSYGKKQVNIVEIKKGFARGGHFHKKSTDHIVISGKLEFREKDLESGQETKKIIVAQETTHIAANVAHLLIALEDTIFFESFDKPYEATYFPEYRKIVEAKLSLN